MSREAFRPYLSPEVLAAIADDARLPLALPTPGAVLFADVSGFTNMSERLWEKLGRTGAEVLTKTLNGYFEAMTAEIEAGRGSIQKFGGDALTVLFAGDPEEATERAIHTAQAMQGRMDAFRSIDTPAGPCSLAMKIGIDAGGSALLVFGDAERRLDFALAGSAVDGCADAEHHASPGEIVLGPHAAALWGGTAERRDEDYAHVLRQPIPPSRRATRRLELQLVPIPAAGELFFSAPLRSRIASGDAFLLNEHRRVVSAFVRFPAPNLGDAAALFRLQDFYVRSEAAISRYGGIVAKVDFGDKGAKFLALFGAPIAIEHAEDAAARALLEVAEIGRTTVGDVAAGLTIGPVFAGDVGSARRREYTVMGDVVNLAARLMQRAGQAGIVAAEAVVSAAAELAWGEIEGFTVKGKAEPVRAARLQGAVGRAKSEAASAVVWLERPTITAPIEDAIRALAVSGESAALQLIGPAGVGKSELMERALATAAGSGIAVSRKRLRSFEEQIPFALGRALVPELLGLSGGDAGGRLEVRLRMRVREVEGVTDDDVEALIELLGWREGRRRGRSSGAEELQERIGVFATLFDRLAGDAPRVLAIDGADHLDFVSQQVLESQRVNASWRLILLAGRRPSPVTATEVVVPPFDEADTSRLLARLIGDERIDAKLAEWVYRRSGGNPLYVRELVVRLLASQAARFDLVGQEWRLDDDRLAVAGFDSLESLLLGRVDSLSESTRRLGKSLAVLGDHFPASAVAALEPEMAPAAVAAAFDELTGAGLIEGAGDGWSFPDSMLREAVYQSVPAEARRLLHLRAARHFDRAHRQRIDDRAGHWFAAAEPAKAIPLLERAARQQSRSLLFRPALLRLDQLAVSWDALPENRRTRPLRDSWRRGLLLAAEVRMIVGDLERAKDALAPLVEPVEIEANPVTAGEALDLLGQIATRQARLDEVLEQAGRLREVAERLADSDLVGRSLALAAGAHARLGEFEQAETQFRQAIELLERSRNRPALGRALQSYAACLYYLDKAADSLVASSRALKIARASRSRLGAAKALVNQSIAFSMMGRRRREFAALSDAENQLKAIGASTLLAHVYGNLNFFCLAEARLDDAIQWTRRQVECIRHLGNTADLGSPASCFAAITVLKGEAALIAETMTLVGRDDFLSGDLTASLEAALLLVRALLEAGQSDDAKLLVDRCRAASNWRDSSRGAVAELFDCLIAERPPEDSLLQAVEAGDSVEGRILAFAWRADAAGLEKLRDLAVKTLAKREWIAHLECVDLLARFSESSGQRARWGRALQSAATKVGSELWLGRAGAVRQGVLGERPAYATRVFEQNRRRGRYSTR